MRIEKQKEKKRRKEKREKQDGELKKHKIFLRARNGLRNAPQLSFKKLLKVF
jgi:hypothetical protein